MLRSWTPSASWNSGRRSSRVWPSWTGVKASRLRRSKRKSRNGLESNRALLAWRAGLSADSPRRSTVIDPLPLSLLNDFLYCPRRAALKIVEGWRSANEHTNRGDIVHEHSDLAGYEVVKGVTLLRALPVWSERLGLNGKCDIVEIEQEPKEKTEIRNVKSIRPVEFKLGKRRKW